MIFFSDAGQDFLAASQAVEIRSIPLLGIPSSVPRFRQGPIMVWLIMIIFILTKSSGVAVGYVVAFLSVSTIVFTFLLIRKQLNTLISILLMLFMASSPLLVAHGRMPFHVSPIPLLTVIYLFALQRVLEKKHLAILLATLAWAMLFQFELATSPMIIGLIYVIWKSKQVQIKTLPSVFLGTFVGLLPQIIYDLTHNFSHLGGFGVWVVYRLVSFAGYKQEHTFSFQRVSQTTELFTLYLGRIVSIDQPLFLVFLCVFLLGICVLFVRRKSLPESIQIVLLLTGTLLLSFFIHGTPSEAYFPPFFVLLPILFFYSISLFPRTFQYLIAVFIVFLAVSNTLGIVRNNFFVQPNSSSFQYGSSYGEQKRVMQYVIQISNDQPYTLMSTDTGAHFRAYLDNYRFQANTLGKPEQAESKTLIFLQHEPSDLVNYPNAKIVSFPSVTVIRVK